MTDAERDAEFLRKFKEHALNEQEIACLASQLQRLQDNITDFLGNPEAVNALTGMDIRVSDLAEQYRAAMHRRRGFLSYFDQMGYGHILGMNRP